MFHAIIDATVYCSYYLESFDVLQVFVLSHVVGMGRWCLSTAVLHPAPAR